MTITRGLVFDMIEQKMRKEENFKHKVKQPTLLDQQAAMLEQVVKQLNKQTKMFLKQQNEGMMKFFELEAMKYASESNGNEKFSTVSKSTILMEKNWLLASEIEHQELLQKLNKSKQDNATEKGSDDDNENNFKSNSIRLFYIT